MTVSSPGRIADRMTQVTLELVNIGKLLPLRFGLRQEYAALRKAWSKHTEHLGPVERSKASEVMYSLSRTNVQRMTNEESLRQALKRVESCRRRDVYEELYQVAKKQVQGEDKRIELMKQIDRLFTE